MVRSNWLMFHVLYAPQVYQVMFSMSHRERWSITKYILPGRPPLDSGSRDSRNGETTKMRFVRELCFNFVVFFVNKISELSENQIVLQLEILDCLRTTAYFKPSR